MERIREMIGKVLLCVGFERGTQTVLPTSSSGAVAGDSANPLRRELLLAILQSIVKL
jgi:hypothetical protein